MLGDYSSGGSKGSSENGSARAWGEENESPPVDFKARKVSVDALER